MTTCVEETVAIIVGAGPSGLATAACLHQLSIPYIILEREDCIASLFNKKTYNRLHLHLVKKLCQLPHLPFPKSFPTYVPIAKFLKYLDDYASHFNINPRFCNLVKCAKYDEDVKRWKVETEVEGGGVGWYEGRFMVVATGETSDVYIPEVDGLSEFKGEVIHSTQYKSGKGYENKNVLVVGSGNSGMEIALDLSEYGAKTSIVVRSPVCLSQPNSNFSLFTICGNYCRRRVAAKSLAQIAQESATWQKKIKIKDNVTWINSFSVDTFSGNRGNSARQKVARPLAATGVADKGSIPRSV